MAELTAAEPCATCAAPLAASAVACEACGALYCPFCRLAMAEASCEHVLAVDDSGSWSGWPFDHLSVPRLDGPPPGGRDWSDDQKRQAFGPVRALLGAYGPEPWRPPDPATLFNVLRERLSVRVLAATWDNARLGEPGYLTLYFAEDPEVAQAELSMSLGKLTRGFQRLQATRPEP
jgi:hypothetical protein